MTAPDDPSWQNVHPDFDGHLERRFEDLTPQERLDWLQQVLDLRRAVHKAEETSGQGSSDNCGTT